MASSVQIQQVLLGALANCLFDRVDGTSLSFAKLLANQALSSVSHDRRWLAFAWERNISTLDLTPEQRLYNSEPDRFLSVAWGALEKLTALRWISYSSSRYSSTEAFILLAGTSLGYVHTYTSTGRLLGRHRLHATACCSIEIRAHGQGLDAEDTSEEITIGFLGGAARIFAVELLSYYSQAIKQLESSQSNLAEFSHSKWDFPKPIGSRNLVMCLGVKVPSLHDRMLGRTSSPKLSILSCGESPALAMHEAPEWGNEGVLAVVSELASGVAGLAKTLAKGRANGYRAGIGSWLGRPAEPKPLQPEKLPCQPGHSSRLALSLSDKPRVVTSLAVSPRGCLAAAADSLGRVLLFDISCMTVMRMWKSYRHAQVSWLTTFHKEQGWQSQLVLFTPKRSRVEIWDPHGPLIATLPACRNGVLFNPSPHFGNENNHSQVYLLDCDQGCLVDICNLLQDHALSESQA